jgi:hypothetical protein
VGRVWSMGGQNVVSVGQTKVSGGQTEVSEGQTEVSGVKYSH